jgi:hypothetical protein
MGMVAPWRCQEPQISVRARQCLHPLGDGVIIPTQNLENLTEKTNIALTKLDSKLKINTTDLTNLDLLTFIFRIIAFTSGPKLKMIS